MHRGSRLAALAAVLGILAAGGAIALSAGAVPRSRLLALGLAAAAVGAAGAWFGPFRSRGLAAAGGAALAFLVIASGHLAGKYRDYLERASPAWGRLRLGSPELERVRAALERGDERAAEEALLDHFRRRPPRDVSTLPPIPPEETERTSGQVLEGKFQFFRDRPVQLPMDLSWREDPLDDDTWRWFLHVMGYIVPLCESYRQTEDARYLQRAEDLVLDWIDDNQLYFLEAPVRQAWHDHVTALRPRAWLVFWETWVKSPLAAPAEAHKVLRAVAVHAEKLASPGFYNESHNHGMEQDLALMAIGWAFPEIEASPRWIQTAGERLERQVAHTVSPNGVHLEHSANYHLFVLGILTRAEAFARRNGLPFAGGRMAGILEKMAGYAAYLIQPDGRIPLLGDTELSDPYGLDDPVLSIYAERDPVLRYALTRGKEGRPGVAAVAFPEEGYCIFRDAWRGPEAFDQSVYILFTAAAHEGQAHKQSDDLSFTLFAEGRDLVVDAGLFGYDARDPGRRHVLSAAAHNGVVVDGRDFKGFDTRIEKTSLEPSHAMVQASHDNYPGLHHRRLLLFVRPGTLLVLDEIEKRKPGAEVHTFEQLFHFDPRMEARVEPGLSAVGARHPGDPGGPRVRIEGLAGGRGKVSVLAGSSNPFRGWVSRSHRKLVPAPVAIFEERGEEAVFAAWLEVGGEDPPAKGGVDGGPAALEVDPSGRIFFRWASKNRPREATITREGSFRAEISP